MKVPARACLTGPRLMNEYKAPPINHAGFIFAPSVGEVCCTVTTTVRQRGKKNPQPQPRSCRCISMSRVLMGACASLPCGGASACARVRVCANFLVMFQVDHHSPLTGKGLDSMIKIRLKQTVIICFDVALEKKIVGKTKQRQ